MHYRMSNMLRRLLNKLFKKKRSEHFVTKLLGKSIKIRYDIITNIRGDIKLIDEMQEEFNEFLSEKPDMIMKQVLEEGADNPQFQVCTDMAAYRRGFNGRCEEIDIKDLARFVYNQIQQKAVDNWLEYGPAYFKTRDFKDEDYLVCVGCGMRHW